MRFRSLNRLILICVFAPLVSIATVPDSLRSTFVSAFERDFNFGPFINHRIPTLTMRAPTGEKVIFRTNNNFIAGLRMHVFGMQLQVAASVNPGANSLSRYGQTNASELSFNYMSHKWFGHVNLFRYSGLWYRYSTENYLNKPFPSSKDLTFTSRSASATHLFNPKKFSMRAPYSFMEHQIKSGGSALVRINIDEFFLFGKNTLIAGNYANTFKGLEQIKNIGFIGVGAAPGYSYNFIYGDFFLNGTIIAGPSLYWIRYKKAIGLSRYESQFNFATDFGLAAGYNGERFFGGITWMANGFQLKRGETRIFGNQNAFSVTAGFRLHEEGIFKKRIENILHEHHPKAEVGSK